MELVEKRVLPEKRSGRYSTRITAPLHEEGKENGFWANFIGGPRLAPGPSLLIMLAVSGIFWALIIFGVLLLRHYL